jgi:hypothetical protein
MASRKTLLRIGLAAGLMSACSQPPQNGQPSAPAAPPSATAPANYAPDAMTKRAIERRAVEAVIWGIPLVNTDAMRQAYFRDVGAKYNDICYFSKPADWHYQVPTPNASTNYVYFNFNVKDGPVVLEIPAAVGAGLLGSVLDAWDEPLADIGPDGADQGKGGKYLLVPPGFTGKAPAGTIPVAFPTYNGYALLRAIPKGPSTADVDEAIALVKKLRIYPLAQAANPPEQRFIDVHGKPFEGIARLDESFFVSLARMVNEEPVLPRDITMMGLLKDIGIEKGKEFAPDAATQGMLKNAAQEAQALFMAWHESYSQPWWTGGSWSPPDASGVKTAFTFETATMLDVNGRGMFNFLAFAGPKKTGLGSFYLTTLHDSRGELLRGEQPYVLHVPPAVPARQYWAVTVYDARTAGFIRESPVVSLDSYNQKLQKNADGSIDIYFGPKAPAGKDSNWIFTAAGQGWFPLFRLYGPDKPLFEKTWKLPEIERASQ